MPRQTGALTSHDRTHLAQYLSLLYAEGEGLPAADMARNICGIDPGIEPARANKTLTARLKRAHWVARHAHLLLAKIDVTPKSRRGQRNRVR